VHKRIADAFHHGPVELGILAHGLELHVLPGGPREVPGQPGHLLEKGAERHHAQGSPHLLRLAGDLVELAQLPGEGRRSRSPQLRALDDHVLRDDQLPDGFQQAIQLFRLNLHRLPQGRADGTGLRRALVAPDGKAGPRFRIKRAFCTGAVRSRGIRNEVRRLRGRAFRKVHRLPEDPPHGLRQDGRAGLLGGRPQPLYPLLEDVDGLQGQVEEPAAYRQRALPGLIEQVLQSMGEGLEGMEPQEAGHALDGVESPEHGIEGLAPLAGTRIAFQIHEARFGVFQVLQRFLHEVRQQVGIGAAGLVHRQGVGAFRFRTLTGLRGQVNFGFHGHT
jgi:hypothetical protein